MGFYSSNLWHLYTKLFSNQFWWPANVYNIPSLSVQYIEECSANHKVWGIKSGALCMYAKHAAQPFELSLRPPKINSFIWRGHISSGITPFGAKETIYCTGDWVGVSPIQGKHHNYLCTSSQDPWITCFFGFGGPHPAVLRDHFWQSRET